MVTVRDCSKLKTTWKDANFFFSFLLYTSYSAIKKYKRQLVDQIKGLETDLDKTASTVREMEVGIYGNPTIGNPCPCLSITLCSTPWLWLQMDNRLPPVSCCFTESCYMYIFSNYLSGVLVN